MELRKCKICNIEKPKDAFPGPRWQCKECQNAKKRENRLKKLKERPSEEEMRKTLKTCLKCTKVKKLIDFTYGSNQCKECNKEKRRQTREKKKQEKQENQYEEKTCSRCNKTKKLIDFGNEGNKCRQCSSEISKLNKEKVIKKEKEMNLKTKTCRHCNVEQDISKFREGEYTCWECQKELLYKWRKQNPEKQSKLYQKYRDKPEIKERIRKDRKDKYHNNPTEKYTRIYRTILRNFLFKNSNSNKNYIFGCEREFFLHWIESNMTLDMKWADYGKTWHLDHLKPCSSYNLTDDKQVEECFNWKNTIPLKAQDNLYKCNKIDEDMIKLYKLKARKFKKIFDKKLQYTQPQYLKQNNTENL